MNNKFFLKKEITTEELSGEIKGVAYTGNVIVNFYGYPKVIIDLSTLTIPKEKTTLLKDHITSQVIGVCSAKKEKNQVIIEGKLSQNTQIGKEIIELSKDGVDWELSVGIYDGEMDEEPFTGKINNIDVEDAYVIRNAVLREVSIVALGADPDTNVKIFSKEKNNMDNFKEILRKFKLSADSDFKDVIMKFEEEKQEAVEEAIEKKEETVEELEAVIKTLKAKIAELEAQIEKDKEEAEVEEREETIEASLREKGIELSKEKIKSFALSKEATELFLESIKEMNIEKKIPVEFTKKHTFSKSELSIEEKANELIKTGRAKDYLDALSKI